MEKKLRPTQAPAGHIALAATLNQGLERPRFHPDVLVSAMENDPLARALRSGQEERLASFKKK